MRRRDPSVLQGIPLLPSPSRTRLMGFVKHFEPQSLQSIGDGGAGTAKVIRCCATWYGVVRVCVAASMPKCTRGLRSAAKCSACNLRTFTLEVRLQPSTSFFLGGGATKFIFEGVAAPPYNR